MDFFSIAAGAAGVGALWFFKLAATKGLPAALTWLKAKWNAGKADLAGLQGDVAGLTGRLSALEQGALAELKTGLETVQADINAIKPKVGL